MVEAEASVRVLLFAALREAAGTAEVRVPPEPLPALLDRLCARFGPRFAERLRAASVLVDGQAVRRDAHVDVPTGADVALLPPVSGGRGARPDGADPPEGHVL